MMDRPEVKREPKSPAIEIQIERAAQLFHTLDPFPFRERDLDEEAEAFIVGWARELPKTAPISIVIHLPSEEAHSEQGREIGKAIRQYFENRADAVSNDLKELFRIGRFSLLIGLAALALCIVAGQIARSTLGNSEFARFLNEGLVILGWVANWRPIEIFLYDWWPLVRRRELYRRLAAAEVMLSIR